MKFIILSFLLSLSAFANECAQDAKKYCSGVEPGKGQLARCLSDYKDSLSPKCAQELANYKKNTGKKNPCFEDLAEFCSDIPSDPLNYEYCLLKYETRLSPTCAKDFRNKKGRIITRNVCAQDIANTCYKEVSGPEGAINRCLIRNQDKLSGFCQKNINKKIDDMKKRNPCFDDTEKFCPTQVKFVAIQDCLSKNSKNLSPKCKPLVQKETEKMKANPCYRDLITHCKPGITPKQQYECMDLNQEHLSNACKQFRVMEKKKIDDRVKVCEPDRLKLCKDAPAKNGGILKCLRENKAQVSPACQKLI